MQNLQFPQDNIILQEFYISNIVISHLTDKYKYKEKNILKRK